MPSLRELQGAFARAVLDRPSAALVGSIMPGGVPPLRRLAVYRNNVQYAFHRVLAGNFPATTRLAGEVRFRQVAGDFLRQHPPAQPQLHAWGGEFPGFLAAHPATAGLPWLCDLARLEWAREEVYYAADAPVLDPRALAAIAEADYPGLRLAVHPTARLLASAWPVHRLWRGDPPQAPVPTPSPEHVLVIRPRMEVLTLPLGPGEHALLAALSAGAPLADAAEAAADREPELDLMGLLARHLGGGTFTSFA